MQCQEIMKRNAECLSPSDQAADAARKMRDNNVGFLPVCDDDGKVLGTLTDRDITVRLVADDRPGDRPVEEIMTDEVVACSPEADLGEAMQLMREHHKSRILCTDGDGRLVGVISLSDIAQVAEDSSTTLRDISARESQAHPQ
jgi:CBS domain-containing protein